KRGWRPPANVSRRWKTRVITPSSFALNTESTFPFKGNMDIDRLRTAIAEAGPSNISFVRMEAVSGSAQERRVVRTHLSGSCGLQKKKVHVKTQSGGIQLYPISRQMRAGANNAK